MSAAIPEIGEREPAAVPAPPPRTGLVPLFAVETLEPEVVDTLPGFQRRMQWFIDNRPDLREHVQLVTRPDGAIRRMLSIVSRDKLPRVLRFMLDEREFLSPHGIRAVSRHHAEQPYVFSLGEAEHRVDYEPAESTSGLFGGLGASHQTGWTALVAKLLPAERRVMATAAIILAGGDGTRLRSLTRRSLATVRATG